MSSHSDGWRVATLVMAVAAACSGKKPEGAAAGSASASAPATLAAVAIDAAPAAPDAPAAIDAAPAGAAPEDAFLIVTDAVVPGKLVATARGGEAALTALRGVRVEVRGDGGRVCEATVGPIVPSPRCVERSTVLVELVEFDGPCKDALYAVAPGRALATTKVQKASPELETAAETYWEENTGRMASEKQALEGLDEAGEIISVRTLRLADLPALALLYDRVHGHRGIEVYAVSGDGAALSIDELGGTRAPAPSRVVGLDVDGDRALDVVIGHGAGVALVLGSGRGSGGDDSAASIHCHR